MDKIAFGGGYHWYTEAFFFNHCLELRKYNKVLLNLQQKQLLF